MTLIMIATGTFQDTTLEQQAVGEAAKVQLGSLATPADVAVSTAAADAVIVTSNRLDRDQIEALGRGVRVIVRAGIGLDAIDLDAAAGRGIAVLNTPDYATLEVADHAVALALALQRKLTQADKVARSAWCEWERLRPLPALSDLTVGILGMGRIGRAVHDRFYPFVKQVLVHDPAYAAKPDDSFRHVDSRDELIRQADILTLHLPLTPGTRHIIGAAEIAALPTGALLVNVSRGGLVDEDALADALSSGQLSGAALDVLETEPPAEDCRLLQAPNLLLTPHVGWYSDGSERRVREQAALGAMHYLRGEELIDARLVHRPMARGSVG